VATSWVAEFSRGFDRRQSEILRAKLNRLASRLTTWNIREVGPNVHPRGRRWDKLHLVQHCCCPRAPDLRTTLAEFVGLEGVNVGSKVAVVHLDQHDL